MTYYPRLRELREHHDMSQSQVAEIIETTTQYYQKYEKGIRPLPIERLVILAKLYQTSTDYILGLTDDPRPYKKSRQYNI